MNDIKNEIKVISIIIGSLIGAGFASGKELYQFFKIYGQLGVLGIIIAGILTAIIINLVIRITQKYEIKNNNEFIALISKNKNKKIEKIIQKFLKNIINIFLVICFFIMVAGFSAYFKQQYNIKIFISATVMAILLYITFMKNINGIIKLNTIIIPILIVIIIIIPITINNNSNLNYELNKTQINMLIPAILSAILYVSYNSIVLFPILISLNKFIKNNKIKCNVILFTTIIFIILAICIYIILNQANTSIKDIELPILKILENYPIQKNMYSIVIIIAIFTSAVSTGYGVLENIETKKEYKKVAATLCLLSIPIAYLGFGKMVKILYPLFGLIGIIQIILIIKTM